LWYEYPIPADYETQKRIIRQLRKWIQSLETRGVVQGFAFNHYFPNPANLNIRFDCTDDRLDTIKKELEQEVKKFIPNYVVQERLWDGGRSPEHVYKAYELGTRCTFLFWDLVEKGRFPEAFISDFLRWLDPNHYAIGNPNAFEFQSCFNHGVMNSLGISKTPNEQLIHLGSLIESTKSTSPEQLLEWVKSQFPIFFPRKPEDK
jgi:hypothetical protein